MHQHRKRGDSLKQKLVPPLTPPLSMLQQGYSDGLSSYRFHEPDNFLSRMPYSSLAAFLLCTTGVILFTTMMMWAFNATIEMIRRTLNITDMNWLDKVQLFFIISAVAMFLVVLALLLIGVLSTGQTRQSIFRLEQARRTGRISCVLAISLASILNVVWTIILALTAILCFVFTIFSALCSSASGHACLDFNVFGSLVRRHNNNSLEFCDGQLQQFCALSNTVIVWYFMGLLGSLLICIGLVHFIATNAVNYSQIGNERRHRELYDILQTEMANSTYSFAGGNSMKPAWRDGRQPMAMNSFMEPDFRHLPTHYQVNDFRNGYNSSNQHHQRRNRFEDSKQQQMRTNKSIGAVLGTHRRHSYQNSLHDSFNCFDQFENSHRRNVH